jgi:hypothetical protein
MPENKLAEFRRLCRAAYEAEQDVARAEREGDFEAVTAARDWASFLMREALQAAKRISDPD